MSLKPVPTEPTKVACDVCLKEIPESVAINQEGDEYAQHFCGVECYAQWKQQHTAKSGKGK